VSISKVACFVGMADADHSIDTKAQQPKSFQGDNGTAEQFSIGEQIEAEQYAQAKVALATNGNPNFGLRFRKLVPPGAD
jgi:hypothetical protein